MWWALLGIAFLVIPLLEIFAIGQVQEWIGWPATVALLVVDSLVGAWLVRSQGTKTWRRFMSTVDDLRIPGEEASEGMLILIGGALLLTPGFFTDALGLACVIPLTRRMLAAQVRRRVSGRITTGVSSGTNVFFGNLGGRTFNSERTAETPQRPPRKGDVIDVEVIDKTPNNE